MKHIAISILLMTSLLVACVGCGGQESTATGMIPMTQEEFRVKVIDYKAPRWEWKYLGSKPAVVYFYTDQREACRMIAPDLEELAREYGRSICIYKVNIDCEKELAVEFNAQCYTPMLVFVSAKGYMDIIQTIKPKSALKEAIDKMLAAK